LPLFDGGRFSLDEHRGVCSCREEAPMLGAAVPCRRRTARGRSEAAWRTYRDRGVVVGIYVQDAEPAARRFIEELGLTFPNGPDAGGRIAIDYGVYGIPELFVVDRDGRITYKHAGAIGQRTLIARTEEALRGRASAREGRGEQYQSIR
jgi:Redoxin